MDELNYQNISHTKKEHSSFLLRVTNIKNRLQNVLNRITDYTNSNKSNIDNIVSKVNSYKSKCKKFTNTSFLLKTDEFKKRLRSGESIDNILPEAIAVAREASRRVLNVFAYDTQIEASIAMIGNKYKTLDENNNQIDVYQRIIADMKTGEGKTLVQILVSYINLLEAQIDEDKSKYKNVHIIVLNDELVKKNYEECSKVFNLLGFSCGYVLSKDTSKSLSDKEIFICKKKNYDCDVVYATLQTLAFDYMHDNIIFNNEYRLFNKPFGFVVIDDAELVLIDQTNNSISLSQKMMGLEDDYDIVLTQDEIKKRNIYAKVTDLLYGRESINKPLSSKVFDEYYKNKRNSESFVEDYIYYKDTSDIIISKKTESKLASIFSDSDEYNEAYLALMNCIVAKHAFIKDVDYTIQREYNFETKKECYKIVFRDVKKKISNKNINGIEEAIEAKEEYMEQYSQNAKCRYHITFNGECPKRAMMSYIDYLSLYNGRVSGMSDACDEKELRELYGFDVYRVSSRKKNIRIDEEDELYATIEAKYRAILKEVKICQITHQPLLIVTTTVQESIEISNLLKKNNITHNLLKDNTQKGNEDIKYAGLYGSVTIITNMVGHGIDIKLGGLNASVDDYRIVKDLGGLYIIGTSKSRSSKIDLQIKSRAGKQADPGRTKFFYSLEDDIVKDYYKDNILGYLKEHFDNNEQIRNKKVINLAKKCQSTKEHMDSLLRIRQAKLNNPYMKQRKIIYATRNSIIDSSTVQIKKMLDSIAIKYSTILVNNYSIDIIKSYIGHIINVDECYDTNRKIFKEKLSKALIKKFNSTIFEIASIDKYESYKYMLNLKKKLINILDIYWTIYINSNDLLIISDSLKNYESDSNERFYCELIPNIYNEMLTYANSPKLKFGEYRIGQGILSQSSEVIINGK